LALFLYFIFFSAWLLLNYKYHGLNASTFLLAVYLVSSIGAIFLMYFYHSYDEEKIFFSAALFHITCLFLFLAPIVKVGNTNVQSFRMPSYKYLNYFAWIIISLSIISIVVASTKLKVVFSYDDLARARAMHNLNELYSNEQRNVFTYLGGIGQHLSLIALFMAFYFSINFPKKKLIFSLLFASSFAVVIQNLTIVGRDGIVRWILFFLFVFFIFKKQISLKTKRKIIKFSAIAIIPMGLLFFQISAAKFQGVGKGIIYYFVDYLGQSFIYFSYNFHQFMNGTAGGRMNFPSLFPAGQQVSINNLNDIFFANYNLNTFSTFVGSFYFDMGLLRTFDAALLFFLIFLFYFRKNISNSFSTLIVYLILYEIVLLGVFYYMFSSTEVVNTFIFIILLSILTDYKSKKKPILTTVFNEYTRHN
jgi:oligosaccharide repeat unit polymerase